MYANRSTLHFDANWRNVGRPTQARTPKRSGSSASSPLIAGAAPKRKRTIDRMLRARGPDTKEVKVKAEDHFTEVVDVTELKASSKLGPSVVETIRKVLEAMYPVCSLLSVHI